MQLRIFESMNDLSNYASDLIISAIVANNNLLLCTATGNSTAETYRQLVDKKDGFPAGDLRVIKLDEWGGVPADHPMTCESYLQQKLLLPLQIKPDNYISLNSNADDPDQECNRIQQFLGSNGPIDLCLLGIGLNGHIAFNEPDNFLNPDCHKAKLSASSLNHPMVRETGIAPKYGLTLGMANILTSKKIILLISGKNKAPITRVLMQKKIDTQLPASFLWLHPDVLCLCDRDAYGL
jgi:galactosamine-6-phosphate isomerase